MSDVTLSLRSPLQGLALPAGPRFALSEAPLAARFILRGCEGARVACGIAFGAEPPTRLGPAGEGAGRAALWLGPDEWLMIADGADPAPLAEMLETVLDGTAHSLVDVSHRQIGLVVEEVLDVPAAKQVRAGRRLRRGGAQAQQDNDADDRGGGDQQHQQGIRGIRRQFLHNSDDLPHLPNRNNPENRSYPLTKPHHSDRISVNPLKSCRFNDKSLNRCGL